jgi:acyl-homoserine lactone acylase PvdQ
MQSFDAGTLNGRTVAFKTTVHGPVVGYARVHHRLVAISSKRSSYGKDALDLLFNRRLSDGQVNSPQSFFKAAQLTPQTFNSFYIDDAHVAEITTGLLPIRPKGTDPSLPTIGTGRWEWRGTAPSSVHPHGIDPVHTPVKGTMTNWNNVSAHGFGAADDAWNANGTSARVALLNYNLARLRRHGKWSLATVTSAMNASATQDVRAILTVPVLQRLLKGTKAPDAQAAKMLSLLVAWRQAGGNLLDLDDDGKIDSPGAAIMNAAWPKIAAAFMRPELGPLEGEFGGLVSVFEAPPGGQFSGWYQYFDRDIWKLLHVKQPQPFTNDYCGAGNLHRCQQSVWAAIAAAGRSLARQQHSANPRAWRAGATAQRITFLPGLLKYTMAYTNRPSGIQQVISFNRHR